MDKVFSEMSNRELFDVLTGGQGPMPQLYLQDIVKDYLESHPDDADLQAMVRYAIEKGKKEKENKQ